MRLLFTTTGHAGHVLPLVPLAHACVRAGHEVRVAGPRSRGGFVRSAGLPFWPFADPPEEEVASVFAPTAGMPPEEANAVVIGEIFGRLAASAALPGVEAMVRTWRPDAIVRESYEFASVAGRRGGGHPARAGGDRAGLDRGLAARAHGRAAARGDPQLAARHLHAAGARRRAGRASLPGRRAPATQRAEPLVYVTFGSVAAGTPLFPAIYRAALDALADLPVRVLMTIGEHGEIADLGPLPANAVVERWVPQAEVLPRAVAMVCHGGYGTTVGALSAGVPLVVAPLFADQGRNAARVAEVGAGLALPMAASIAAADVSGLDALVRRVLDEPSFGRAARRVADSARALPHVDAAPAVLEAIAGRRLAA